MWIQIVWTETLKIWTNNLTRGNFFNKYFHWISIRFNPAASITSCTSRSHFYAKINCKVMKIWHARCHRHVTETKSRFQINENFKDSIFYQMKSISSLATTAKFHKKLFLICPQKPQQEFEKKKKQILNTLVKKNVRKHFLYKKIQWKLWKKEICKFFFMYSNTTATDQHKQAKEGKYFPSTFFFYLHCWKRQCFKAGLATFWWD